MIDKIFDFFLDSRKEKFYMMENNERKLLLEKLRRKDETISSVFYFLLVALFALVGFSAWVGVSVTLMNTEPISFSFVFDFVLFSVALFFEVGFARTNSRVAFLLLIATTILACIISPFFVLALLWLVLFAPNWLNLQAMRELPGYPAFEARKTNINDSTLNADQQVAFERKKLRDMDEPDAYRNNSENLDKILSGELSLDDYLGVENQQPKFLSSKTEE